MHPKKLCMQHCSILKKRKFYDETCKLYPSDYSTVQVPYPTFFFFWGGGRGWWGGKVLFGNGFFRASHPTKINQYTTPRHLPPFLGPPCPNWETFGKIRIRDNQSGIRDGKMATTTDSPFKFPWFILNMCFSISLKRERCKICVHMHIWSNADLCKKKQKTGLSYLFAWSMEPVLVFIMCLPLFVTGTGQ